MNNKPQPQTVCVKCGHGRVNANGRCVIPVREFVGEEVLEGLCGCYCALIEFPPSSETIEPQHPFARYKNTDYCGAPFENYARCGRVFRDPVHIQSGGIRRDETRFKPCGR